MTSFVSRYDEKEYFDSIDYLYNLIEDDNSEYIINLIFIKLVITLEVFIERLSKPFTKECNNLTVKKLPTRIKLEHSKLILKQLNDKISYSEKHSDCERLFSELNRVWNKKDEHKIKLNFDLKFKSGKHGDKEIIKIFEKIGIDNILSKIKIEEKSEGILDSEIKYIDIEIFIQELVEKRNLAIHQGVNLAVNYSKKNIAEKIYTTKRILQEINKILDNHITYLRENSS